VNNELKANSFESLQEGIVKEIEQFSKDNPEIVEAMKVMNMSMDDYIQAMDSVRATQTFSCSSFTQLPTHLPAEIGH
jgi:hypothetical protein